MSHFAAKWTTVFLLLTCCSSSVFAATTGDAYEPNDTTATSYNLSYYGMRYTALIAHPEDVDTYNFTSGSNTVHSLSLRVPADKNYDLIVYDSSGQEIAAGRAGAGTPEELSFRTSAGKVYYVLVTGSGVEFGEAPYTLMLSESKYEYSYDAANRLREINDLRGAHRMKITFTYDPNGNLIKKQRTQTDLW